MTMSSRRGRALLCPLNPDIFIGRSRTPPLRGTIVLFHPVFFQTFDPGVYTYRSLVVFVHFIQGETDEFAIDDSGRIVVGVAGSIHAADEFAARGFQVVVDCPDCVAESITERRRIAAAEQPDQLPG